MTSGDFAGLGYPQLAGVFAGYGTYTYTLNVGWTKIDDGTPTLLTSGDYRGLGYAQLAGVFTGYGTYIWSNSTGWIKIDNGNPTLLTSGDFLGASNGNNNNADLAGYFPRLWHLHLEPEHGLDEDRRRLADSLCGGQFPRHQRRQ